jgi:hypothetical protein
MGSKTMQRSPAFPPVFTRYTLHVQVRFGVVNGLGASSNTTSMKPHEFFDPTPMAKSEQTFKNDHDWRKCQAFQLIRIFGTHRRETM